MGKPFYVEAHLATPLAFSPRLLPPVSLDTLLMRVLLGPLGELWPARNGLADPGAVGVPLDREVVGGREVLCGSVGFPVGPVKWGFYPWVKRWHGRRPEGVSQGTGYYRDMCECYYLAVAPKVRFYGRGDVEKVLGILRYVKYLGHKHKRGNGRVAMWEAAYLRTDHSVWLKLQDMVTPARVLPASALAEAPPGAVYVRAIGSPGFPRWDRGGREGVVLPLPVVYQEGLADGDREAPRLNPSPDYGKAVDGLEKAMRRWLEKCRVYD